MPLSAAGSLLLVATAAVAAEPRSIERANLDSTNRITASLRFGLNISGKFTGTGGTSGGAGHYLDGYALADVRGAGPRTWNWGYDYASQLNASAPSSVDMHRYAAPGVAGENSGDVPTSTGFEVTYDYGLGVKEDWHDLRYGIEAAFNFMPVDFNSGGTYGNVWRDTYGYTPGTTPPPAPYAGGPQGPNFEINVPATSALVPGATFLAQQHFDANLWGFRLGPYLETPLSQKLSLHLSGGLAVGILDASANWKETLALPSPANPTSVSGGGNDTSVLWGYYFGLDAVYRFNPRWGADVGVQLQDLGTYGHNFGGRTAELDLSNSVFIQAGVSYSF